MIVKRLGQLFVVVLVAALAAVNASAQPQTAGGTCAVTPVTRDVAPSDPSADSVTGDWHINADRTIWVSVPAGGWATGGKVYQGSRAIDGQKTYWVRPAGSQFAIAGRRIDARAPALGAHIPCCYPSGFQIVALFFPTEGCWEVSATAGDRTLTFVTQVKPANLAGRH